MVKIKSDDIGEGCKILVMFMVLFLPADKIDFVRDVVAYLLVVALVVGVAYDGTVSVY